MRLLHINSYYSTSKFYKNLYDMQVKCGLDIEVYVPVSKSYNNDNYDFGEYTNLSLNYGKYDRFFYYLKQNKIFKDIIKNYDIEKYALIHAHSLFTNGYIAYKLKNRYGIPYIVAVRDTDLNVFFKKMIFLRRLGVEILKSADKIVMLSTTYKNKLISKYIPDKLKKSIIKKIDIIPNGIDDFWLNNKFIRKGLDTEKTLKLLQVGEISKRKNQLITTAAVSALRDQNYNIDLTVVGKVKSKSIFNTIKKVSFIKYIKPVSKEKLIDIYRDHDIFIMPSVTETFGLVYPEAMSQGLPVIYTKGQGFDGQFEEGEVGYSVDCFNVKDIKDKIIKTTENYEKLSAQGIIKCDKFNWNKINKQYIDLYTK